MSYAYEIPNWLTICIRQSSWAHEESFWHLTEGSLQRVWRNQKGVDVSQHLHELFSSNDWVPADIVVVWDWALAGIELDNPENRVAKILKQRAAGDVPKLAYKVLGTERVMTAAAYKKNCSSETLPSDWAGIQ